MTDVTNEEVLIAVRELKLILMARFDGPVASDFELDSAHGSPKVRFDPKSWRGGSFRGRRMSECSAEFLDHLAHALSNMADKEDSAQMLYRGRPKSRYTRLDAARARGWALRKRLRGEDATSEAPAETPRAPAFGGGGSAFGGPSAFGSTTNGSARQDEDPSGDDFADFADDEEEDAPL